MNKIISGVFLLFIAVAACSTSRSFYLDEEYDKNVLSSPFVVLPFKQNWTPTATLTGIYGKESNYFYLGLDPSFTSNTPNDVKIINSDLESDKISFTPTILETENMSMNVSLPSDELLNSFSERYVYFFENYGFRIMEKKSGDISYAGLEANVYKVLYFKTKFFLLDKSNKKIVSWGEVADQVRIADKPEFPDYLELLTKISNTILQDGPFKVYR